jgi:hypothetical protein
MPAIMAPTTPLDIRHQSENQNAIKEILRIREGRK